MKRSLAVLMMTVGASACGGPTGPVGFGMRVTVSVSAVQARLGADTLTVAVSAVNITGRSLTVDFLGPCSLSFEVLDDAGNVVAPIPAVCPIIDFVTTLSAGDTLGLSFDWGGERQWGTGDYVVPGPYRVRGVLDTREGPVYSVPVAVQLLAVR